MLRVVDIVYHCHAEFHSPAEVLKKHHPTLGFVPFIKDKVEYTVVRHLSCQGYRKIDGVQYAFFSRSNKPWQIPFRTHRYIKSVRPDIVLVHGFVFPLQVMALARLLGKKCKIVLQHHAEQPRASVRKLFQKKADGYISAYLFTAPEIAAPWLAHKVISNPGKVKVLTAASAIIEQKDKAICKSLKAVAGNHNFLWVGRLNQNKDPITVLRAFTDHVQLYPCARLFMVYQTTELLKQVKYLIEEKRLHQHVILLGKLPHEELSAWYHAADYFISASHAEAAGYALLEAMSAGCIPVVSKIPSYQKILENFPCYFFSPGNATELTLLLNRVPYAAAGEQSAMIKGNFRQRLGFEKIAENMFELFNGLYTEQR